MEVDVRVGVNVWVGVRLGGGVDVGTGRSPMRMTIDSTVPTFPSASRIRAETVVSPSGKLFSRLTGKQN
jgi:hypothetical protein